MFPVPTRLQLPGDIVNYAYENQVMLMMRVTPPKDLPVGKSVTISGKASWLVCQEECLPGKADVSIELPVGQAAAPANADLFKQWTSQLPVKNDADDIASLSHSKVLSNGAGTAAIDINWKKTPGDAQYIPGTLKNGDIASIKTVTAGNATKITFSLTGYKDDEPVTGLLVFTSAAGVKTGLEISIPYGADVPAVVPAVVK